MIDLAPSQPYDDGTRVELDAVPLAVVRHEGVTLADLRELFDDGFGAIGGLIGRGAIVPAGPALAVYSGDPQQRFDLMLGFPVVEPLDSALTVGDLEVAGATLPSGPALAATHVGAYDGVGEAWGRLFEIADATPTGTWIEVYVTEPGTDPDALRTDLLMPISD